MRYSVVTEDGRRLGASEADGEPEKGEEGGCCGGGGSAVREFLSERKGDAMLRMANQSIFADMLQAIQGCLLRPDLEISVISRDCEFFLDFSRGVLEAHSLFEVSTVGGGGPGAPETLEIAQIKGTACVDSQAQACSQRLLSPQLRMVFDDNMRASAKVLALHSFMDGGMHGPGAGMGRGNDSGGSSSLHRMGALQESLKRASSDGMGRAAAAGTGLLANVVAGVGSAIGASRTGTAEGEGLAGVGIVGGGAGTRGASYSHGAAPLVQLYRRTDDADGAAAPAGGAVASAQAKSSSKSSRSAVGFPGGDRPASSIDSGTDALDSGTTAVAGQTVPSTGSQLPGTTPGRDGSSSNACISADAGGAGDWTERRSALGMASATGGAVLRGLWGGVQSAAAAGAAVAAQVSAVAEERAATDSGGGVGSSGRNSQPAPEFRLYRRDGDT
ncbi:unnamed protein product [Pylaiella littoralis]